MTTEFYNSNQFKSIMSSLALVTASEEDENHHPTTADYVVDPFADGIIISAEVVVVADNNNHNDPITAAAAVDPFADGMIVCATTTTTTTEPMTTDEGTTTTTTTTITPVMVVDEEQEPTTSTTTVLVVPSTSTEEDEKENNNNKIIEYPDGHQLTLKEGAGGADNNGGGRSLDSSSSSSTGHTCDNTTVEGDGEEEDSTSSSSLSLSSSPPPSSPSSLSLSHNEGNNNSNVAINKKKKQGDEQELLELDKVVVVEEAIVIDTTVPSSLHVDETLPPAADITVPRHAVNDDNEPDVDITATGTGTGTEEEGDGEVEVEESKIMVPDAPPPTPTEEEEVEEVEECNISLHATPPSLSSTIKSNDNEKVDIVVIVDTAPDVDVDVDVDVHVDAAVHALSVEDDAPLADAAADVAEGELEDNNNQIVEEIVIDEDNANEGGMLFSTTIENIDDDGGDDDESIEEITIADEVEEYNDEDDGMSVSTAGEFFEITAHIEVLSDFVTTTNNDNHYHHDIRSYDEVTADDCELYDENTIDDEVVVDDDDNDGDDIPDRVVNDSDIPKDNSNSNPEMKGIEEIVVGPDPDHDDPSFDDDDDLVDVPAEEGAEVEEEVEKVALVVKDAPTEEEQDTNNTTLLALPPSTIKTSNETEQAEDDTPPPPTDPTPDDYVDAAAKEGGDEESVAPLVKGDIEEETTNDNTLESQPSIKMNNDIDDEEESVDDKPKHSMTMKIEKKDGDELQEEEEEEVNHDKVPNNNDKTMNVKNDDDDQEQKGVVAEGTSTTTTTTTALDDELPSPSPLTPTMSFAERMKKMFDSSSPDEPSMAFDNNSNSRSISVVEPTCTSAVQKEEEEEEERMVEDSTTESTTTFSIASAFTDDDNGINKTIVQKVDKNEKKPNDKVMVPKVLEEKKIPSAAEQMVSLLWASSSKSKTKIPVAASTTTTSRNSTEVDSSDSSNSGQSYTAAQLDSTATNLVKLVAQADDPIVVAEEDVTASQKKNIDKNRIVIDDDKSGPATAVVDSTPLPITASQSKQKDAAVDLPIVCNSVPPVADATSRKKNKLSDRLNMFDSPTNSKSNSGNIPPAFTNKQPSWRKEKPSATISKAGGADNKPLVVVNKTSQEEKVVTDVEKSSPSATSTVCHDKDLLVEHIVSLLNESGRMQNKNLLASRIVSLLGGDDKVIGGMMVKSVMATTNSKYYSTDSLDTTPHSSRSRFDDGSPKITTINNLTVRTNHDEEGVEADEVDAYISRKKDSFKDPGLKKMRNDSLKQKEKLRRCDDPDTSSIRILKRVSIKELKLKESQSTAKENADGQQQQQQQRPEEQKSTNSLSPVAIDGNNNRNDALLAEQVMARIWPKDKVRPSPSSTVSNCPMKKTPSTKKLGDRLKMFDCPLPEASSSPSWSSSSSSPRSGYTTSSFKINSPINENTTAISNISTSSNKDYTTTASSLSFLASSITERNEISRNTLKKLSSFQRLWRRVNKSKKNTSAKDCSGSVSSLSSTASLPTSKPMTNSEPPTPTTTNNKKIIVGNNNGINNEVYYTLDDFEQKRHGEIDMERWEYYLHDEEFQKCFNGLIKDEFYLQPKWKQDKQKWKLRVAF